MGWPFIFCSFTANVWQECSESQICIFFCICTCACVYSCICICFLFVFVFVFFFFLYLYLCLCLFLYLFLYLQMHLCKLGKGGLCLCVGCGLLRCVTELWSESGSTQQLSSASSLSSLAWYLFLHQAPTLLWWSSHAVGSTSRSRRVLLVCDYWLEIEQDFQIGST